jgi:hypothetical protein
LRLHLQAILLKLPAPKGTLEYKHSLESRPPNMMGHRNAQAPPIEVEFVTGQNYITPESRGVSLA